MCVQTICRPRTKSVRPTPSAPASPSTAEKPQKFVKTFHSILKVDENDANSVIVPCKTKPKKSVSFNEVVVIRPHYLDCCEREKSVAFNEVVIVRPVLHLADFTDEEIINSWYILSDKKRIKKEILQTLKLAKQEEQDMMNAMNGSWSSLQNTEASSDNNNNNNNNNNTSEEVPEICLRGLERLQDGGKGRERRRTSIREVLQEQQAQRIAHQELSKDGKSQHSFLYDTAKFRKTYRPFSRASRKVAQERAKEDEEDVQ